MSTARTSELLDVLILPVERTGLLARVREHLPRGIVTITAAAGYGKTTFLNLMARRVPRSIWLPLTLMDQDQTYLEERLRPYLGGSVILLDDVHVLEGATEAQKWLGDVIRSRPWDWALSGRWMPNPLNYTLTTLPTLHITEKDLALSEEEAVNWLTPLGYSEDDLRAWYQRTEGWPLALAALARLSTQYAVPSFVETSLEEFLDTVIFARLWNELDEPMRLFLTLTAVPLEFTLDLATYLWERYVSPQDVKRCRLVWQEIVQRRLFLEPGTQPHTWRYHALFRAFLRRQIPNRQEVARSVVAWYELGGRPAEAIEQALADALWDEAARLLVNLPIRFIHENARVYTYRRWILSLPRPVLHRYPLLLTRLGMELCAFREREEGLSLVQEGVDLINASGDARARVQAYQALAWSFLRIDDFENARFYARRLLAHATEAEERCNAHLVIAHAYNFQSLLLRARHAYRLALQEVDEEKNPQLAAHIRDSLAAAVLAPLGFVREACALLAKSRPTLDKTSILYGIHLEQWASILVEVGEWQRAREKLQDMGPILRQSEAVDRLTLFWYHWLWTMYYIWTKEWEKAEEALTRLYALGNDRQFAILARAQAQTWMARRQGNFEEAVRTAEEALEQMGSPPLERGQVALERDIAVTEITSTPPPLHPATRWLLTQRVVTHLLRVRALLAWRCYRAGHEEKARRHIRRALAVMRRFPELHPVLVRRDPDLAFHFWRVALLLGEAEEEAVAALGDIAPVNALAELLGSPDPSVRVRVARALAATRREEAMVPLHQALKREHSAEVRRHLEASLVVLEALPPPVLKVHFLGTFRVQRGDEEIPHDRWPRPSVIRLFQYLVLHRGRALPRDRILEDLWPTQPPVQAAASLRRLISWLRRVLEPYMRSKGPFRYLTIAWNTYTFDPQGRVWVDVEEFEKVVMETLTQSSDAPLPPLPAAFITALESWAEPVSAAMYEDWWLQQQQHWRNAYMQGCVYAARAYLARRDFRRSIMWADRALTVAPWLEEAYRMKMQALARLGERGEALNVYEEARIALARELGVDPSPETEWLAERLRRGEEI